VNLLDVNVLIALFRGESAHHSTAMAWWSQADAIGAPFTVTDPVWASFVRVVTNPRAFDVAATFDEAWAFVGTIRSQPTYRRYLDAFEPLHEFERLCRGTNATGNLVTDAYIAACASAIGATVVTFDRDFRKFDGLRVLELSV